MGGAETVAVLGVVVVVAVEHLAEKAFGERGSNQDAKENQDAQKGGEFDG